MYEPTEVELLQEKEGFTPTKWWQALDSDGNLLAETSVRSDFKNLGLDKEEDITYRRIYERVERKWVEDTPFTVNTHDED